MVVLPSSDPVEEIGSRYRTNVYDCNRLSLLIIRQKMAQSCGMMFIDLQNTWNTFPVSEQKIILSN